MPQCKAKTKSGSRCKNAAVEGSDYCHVESHGHPLEGNNYWTFRGSHGRDPIFNGPEELWDECVKYFEWVTENPLKEQKVFHSSGEITKTSVTKMRAMTLKGLCLFLGISENTWRNYREKDDFLRVITRAESIIYTQKFEGASADLLNSNIIARDLGLKDRKHLSGGIDINYSELTNDQLQRIAAGEDPMEVIDDS